MAANQYGIDLASMYGTVANVKGKRAANKLAQFKIDKEQKYVDEEPERKAKAANILALRQKGVAGNVDAQQQLLALDPEGGATFLNAVGNMNKRQREQAKQNVEQIGQMSSYVLGGNTDQERERRYQLVRQNVSPEALKGLPETYSQDFVELSLSKATAMDKLLEAPTSVSVGGEDVLYRGGREIERSKKPVKGGAGSGGLKSGDESLMYKQSVELLGGIFDQAGNITNLDPNVRNKAQAIATEATRIYKEKGNITRSQAVTEAAKKYGMEIQGVDGELEDPLGIR